MIVVTIGGVVVGFCILIWYAVQWWPGKKTLLSDPLHHVGALAPFLLGWAYGALGILTSMGLIGWAFDMALWASNWLGDAAVWVGVAGAPGRTATGAPVQLTGYGDVIVLLLTVLVVGVIKFRPVGGQVKLGVWCGCCLGTWAVVAGAVGGPLAIAANAAGGALFGGMA